MTNCFKLKQIIGRLKHQCFQSQCRSTYYYYAEVTINEEGTKIDADLLDSYFKDPRFFIYFCERSYTRDLANLFLGFDTNKSGKVSFREVDDVNRCRSGDDGQYDEEPGGDDKGNCPALDALGLNFKGDGECS